MDSRNQPPIGFNFTVSFSATNGGSQSQDNYFQRVDGISGSREVEEIKEGGVNDRVYKLPKSVSYDNLILERGFAYKGSNLGIWCTNSLTMPTSKIETKVVIVTLLDYDSKTQIMNWAFYDCYPIKWKISEFKSTESVLAIETLELAYSYFSLLS
jgi:phage tail-like protein